MKGLKPYVIEKRLTLAAKLLTDSDMTVEAVAATVGSSNGQKAKIEGGVLTVLKHEHAFGEATCTADALCACGARTTTAYISGVDIVCVPAAAE